MDRSVRARLDRLGDRWGLPEGSSDRLERLLALLERDPYAHTAVTEPAQAVEVHVADSLLGLFEPDLRAATEIVDIGSGAGLPGLVLATALPSARVDLVESAQRKCDFIERAAEEMGLENTRVVSARVEEWAAGDGAGRYGAATVRAVAALPTLVEYAAPLLRRGGVLVAWKGRRDPDEEQRAARAALLVGMEPDRIIEPGDPNRAIATNLHTFRQTHLCPPEYPRRPGRAQKRPLA